MVPRRTVLGAALALLAVGCGSEDAVPGDAGRIDAELVARLSAADRQEVAGALGAFGFDLLGELDAGRRNTVISPLSVAALLALLLAGARERTAGAMADVLHLDSTRDVRVGALLRLLADTKDVDLSVANALWADKGFPVRGGYLDYVEGTLGATVREAELGSRKAADDIDAWASEQTEGRIEEMAEDLGLPSPNASLVLLNAVYFLGTWTKRFDRDATRKEPFTLASGERVRLPMMHMSSETYSYARRDGYEMLRLPYGDEERYGMEVMLPGKSGIDGLLKRLDLREWRAATGALAKEEVQELALPRFELRWGQKLNTPLSRLGMATAFEDGDFTRISKAAPALDVVVHKTYIRVDENGTEAAAVTGGAMLSSAPVDPLVFRVDRPFAFTISDRKTGSILFLGTVLDPRE